MEEIKSGESLEREILEDAKKQAAKILSGVDREIARITKEYAKKLDEDVGAYETKIERDYQKAKMMAEVSLPIERNRLETRFREESLESATSRFFHGLSELEKEEYLSVFVAARISRMELDTVSIQARGLSGESVDRISKTLGLRCSSIEHGDAGSLYERGIVVSGGKVRIRAYFSDLRDRLYDESRDELVRALCGADDE